MNSGDPAREGSVKMAEECRGGGEQIGGVQRKSQAAGA
jgi:hypothetical protein